MFNITSKWLYTTCLSPCLGLLNMFLYWEESHGLVSRCSQGTSSNGFRQNHSYQQWMFIILDDSDLNHIGKWVYIYQTITIIYWMFQFVSSHFRRCPVFSNQGYTRVFSVEWPKMWRRTWNMLKPPVTSWYRLIVWLLRIYVHCCWLYSHRFSILPKGNRSTRLRDKMLVFVGPVKKCLQDGHSFRLAGVWLKFKMLHSACTVNQFCSSSANKKPLGISWFSSSHANIHRIIHPFFFTSLSASVPSRAFGKAAATDSNFWRHEMTPCPAVSPRVSFFVHLLFFLAQHGHWSPFFEVFPCTSYLSWVPATGAADVSPDHIKIKSDHDQIYFAHATTESASETFQQRQQVPWALCYTHQERYHTTPTP